MSVTADLQHLLSSLKSRKSGLTRKDVERLLDCSAETARRALKRLRDDHRYPIVHEKGRYRLDGDVKIELPGVAFRPEELAALLGLVQWMESSGAAVFKPKLEPLRERLEKDLRAKGIDPGDWGDRIRLLPQHFRIVDPEVLVGAVDAVLRRKRVILEYKGTKDASHRERKVSPQRIVQYRHNWYLDVYEHSSRTLRCFALSRMRNLRPSALPAYDVSREELETHFAEAYGIFGGRARGRAVLLFEGEAARIVAEERWHPKQRLSSLKDGKVRLEFPCGDVRELARDVMRFADEVTVVGPPVLRTAVAGMVQRAGDKAARRETRN